MATQTSKSLVTHTTESSFSKIWYFLTSAPEGLTGSDSRRATILSALTLVFIPLAFITVFLTPLRDVVNGESYEINSGGSVGIVLVIGSYLLSRTKYFRIAAYVIVFTPFVAVVAAIQTSPSIISESAMIFLSLGVIFSSLLLLPRDTLIIGVISIGLLLYFSSLAPDVNLSSIVTYTLITTGIMSLVSQLRESNLQEIEKAQDELKAQIERVEAARVRAERSDQVKSAFLASMSHELRTPLNAIINFTRFVSKGTLGPVNEDQVETLDNVIVSGKHLLNLINDVLDMAKIESDSLTLFVSDDVAIDEIVKEVSTTGRALLHEKSVELTTAVEESLPQIRGDHQRIRQILLNIVSNACKFTNEGTINITAKQDADTVIISVADTGCGIAKDDQAMVFEAFKQTTDGLRQGGGTGLGMPITKNLIEAHGGTLQLESEFGKGSTFHIHLPIKSTKLSPTLITEV